MKTVQIPGTPAFQRSAREIMCVRIAVQPNDASDAGLFDDAAIVPSFSPASVRGLLKRTRGALKELRRMPWRDWSLERQIDFRWVYARGKEVERKLSVEKSCEHRPADWLEPLAYNLVAFLTYAPERTEAIDTIAEKVPAMVAEMRAVCVPTLRDIEIADGILEGLVQLLPKHPAALEALEAYRNELKGLSPKEEYRVVGAKNYAWRFKHALLLEWTPEELLALAEKELAAVDAARDALRRHREAKTELTEKDRADAAGMARDSFMGLYDAMVEGQTAALKESGLVTIPEGVGPIRARETPKAIVPLTGDGGSMNPPPVFSKSDVGYWNVENFNPEWPLEKREKFVYDLRYYNETAMAPYSAHEGVPGHHLQLSIARLNPNRLRSMLWDSLMVEGWALYAEQAFWEAGGSGPSVAAHLETLDSWRFRIRRVFYDVNVETGRWTLQQAADWKHAAEPGKGKIDPDVLRTVNWPTQLIGYFTGKMQILRLKDDCRKKWGKAYSERRFHDEFLAVGSVPVVFARAKLLGEPLPDLD
ncbi:MAG: hypothetical protein CO113_11750 [Elusimicrobia bacterium CG_4_9_14_3_um_filter_62_55]|nr:MAG: hypothetical protein COR54_00520 [Elusimicrobia bacterium CG22_combo_CG10-13_8_21_14_all_63_91]PJA15804.1 MAG: hypothetical protein COX66_09260 [Elusimicrobia bacterium CG_4_10_14_0_2_um_filter_63_34]PJB24896.1 MAG: hypothetical protein CO113_11750 [Elusimicrobia bacterium CG_4_9_14_3_um_filter_62_55]